MTDLRCVIFDVDGTLGVRLIRVAPDPGGEGYGR